MNDIVSRMIDTQLLFLYMLCGFIVSRIGIVREANRGVLVRLLMDVAMPMTVLNAFDKPTTKEEILSSLMVMVIFLVGCVVTGLIGLLLFGHQPNNRRKVPLYANTFSNAGNAGLPIISLVFGPVGVFYASMYLIPPRIGARDNECPAPRQRRRLRSQRVAQGLPEADRRSAASLIRI